MLATNPRFDLFKFSFPSDFFKNGITEKYNLWLNIEPRNIDNIGDAINQSIQTIALPSFGNEPIVQQQPFVGGSIEVSTNTVSPFESLIEDKTFTVTLKHTNGFMNYFLLLEHYIQYSENKNGNFVDYSKIPDLSILIHDINGNILFTYTFVDVIFTGISELELSKSNIRSEFNTFDARFKYTSYRLDFHTPERKKIL